MVKYFSILFFFIAISCANKETSKSTNEIDVNYYVSNKLLEREILYFLDSVKQKNTEMVNMNVSFFADTAFYDIRYSLSAQEIYSTPSTFFINIKSTVISITYEESRSSQPFTSLSGVLMSEKKAWDILKYFYPEEYEYYLRNDSIVYGIPTGGGEVWRLKFKNNEFLGKQIIIER